MPLKTQQKKNDNITMMSDMFLKTMQRRR